MRGTREHRNGGDSSSRVSREKWWDSSNWIYVELDLPEGEGNACGRGAKVLAKISSINSNHHFCNIRGFPYKGAKSIKDKILKRDFFFNNEV